jgi:hypothetical protein
LRFALDTEFALDNAPWGIARSQPTWSRAQPRSFIASVLARDFGSVDMLARLLGREPQRCLADLT